ncbi:MAG TPA: universal stress protein [Chloroflexota bacterium]|nr:universal stress protein [Chloroflexota bacterium]
MYRRILVALDGSVVAEAALPHAQALAKAFGATVLLLRATTPPEQITPAAAAGPTPVAGPMVNPTPIIEAELRAASAYLAATAETLASAGVTVQCLQRDGAPAQVILDEARAHDADLIVMTTHGRGGMLRLAYGSVADAVLRHAPCPVVLVRIQPPPDE